MGLIYANINLANAADPTFSSMDVNALVDTGSNYLCIPRHIANQLNLKVHEEREVTLADGSRKLVDYVGPVHIKFMNRQCFVGAMVLGETALLGAIPIEDMDLVIHPAQLKLTVNPENPNMAAGIVM